MRLRRRQETRLEVEEVYIAVLQMNCATREASLASGCPFHAVIALD